MLEACVDIAERFRRSLELGKNFQNDMVLVDALIDVGDLALAEGIVERVIDGGNGNAQASGGVAVDHERSLEPIQLLIGVYVP